MKSETAAASAKAETKLENKNTTYELSAGAIAILEDIIPRGLWYKDDPKQGTLIIRSVGALDALPTTAPRPAHMEKETQEAFLARVDTWGAISHAFEWSEKQRDAVKVCVRYNLKQGNLLVSDHTVALLKMLGLDDE